MHKLEQIFYCYFALFPYCLFSFSTQRGSEIIIFAHIACSGDITSSYAICVAIRNQYANQGLYLAHTNAIATYPTWSAFYSEQNQYA